MGEPTPEEMFDEDILKSYRARDCWDLALVAQDLRNLMAHVNGRSLLAAIKRKQKAEHEAKAQTEGSNDG